MKKNFVLDKTLLDAATIQESQANDSFQKEEKKNKMFQETLIESDGSAMDESEQQQIDRQAQMKDELQIKDLPSKEKDVEDLEDLFNFDKKEENEVENQKLIQKKEIIINKQQNSYIVTGYLTQLNTTPEKIQKSESENNQVEKQNYKRLKPLKNQINNKNKKQQKESEQEKKQMQKPKPAFPSKYTFPSLKQPSNKQNTKEEEIKTQSKKEEKQFSQSLITSRPKIECTMAVVSPVLSPKKPLYKSAFWNESYKIEPTFAIGSPANSLHEIEEEKEQAQEQSNNKSNELKKELTQPLESPLQSPRETKDENCIQHQKTVSLCSEAKEDELEEEKNQNSKMQKLKNMTTMQFDSSASDKKEIAQKRTQNEFLTQGTPEQQQLQSENKKKSKKNKSKNSKSSGLSSQISNNSQNKQHKFQQKEEEKFQAQLKHSKLTKTQTQQIEDLQVKIALSVFFSSKLKINKNTKDALKLWNVFVINKLSEDFNIFVVTEIIKEYAFLKAINIGAKIVKHKWIQESIEQNKLLNYIDYQLPKEEFINSLGIDVQASLSKTLVFESNIFDNIFFWITPNLLQKAELEQVIRSGGGAVCSKSPLANPDSSTENVIALVNKHRDEKKIKEFAKANITMHEVEFIIMSCLKQELDFSIGNVLH